jgi:hypothetical protein
VNTKMSQVEARHLPLSPTTLSRMQARKACLFGDGLDTPVVLTAAHLRKTLDYDLDTGVFTWLEPTTTRTRVGSVAGCTHEDGYVYVGLDYTLHRAHRLAWYYVYGEWPDRDLDHRDTIRHHNWIDNLRLATQGENSQNLRKPTIRNQCGLLGVSPYRGKFQAQIRVQGVQTWLGCYVTPEEAHAVYLVAKRELHPFGTL